MVFQQQYSSKLQLGHSLEDELDIHFNTNNSKDFVGWFIGMKHEILDAFESST